MVPGGRLCGYLNYFVLRVMADIFEVIVDGFGLGLHCDSSAELMLLKQKEMYGERERSL